MKHNAKNASKMHHAYLQRLRGHYGQVPDHHALVVTEIRFQHVAAPLLAVVEVIPAVQALRQRKRDFAHGHGLRLLHPLLCDLIEESKFDLEVICE